jgi:hypothetical protein
VNLSASAITGSEWCLCREDAITSTTRTSDRVILTVILNFVIEGLVSGERQR